MKRSLYITALLIFQLSSINSHSQFIEDIKQSFQSKPKLFVKYNTRSSLIATRGARINSVNAGFDFDKKTRVGLGYEWLGSKIESEKLIFNDNTIDTVNTLLKLRYISTFCEYVFYRDKKWEFSLPIIFSFGKAGYYYEENDKQTNFSKAFVFGYETQMIGQYSVFRWFGIGGGIGYRLMFKEKNKISENFTSPIYILRLKVFFDKLKD